MSNVIFAQFGTKNVSSFNPETHVFGQGDPVAIIDEKVSGAIYQETTLSKFTENIVTCTSGHRFSRHTMLATGERGANRTLLVSIKDPRAAEARAKANDTEPTPEALAFAPAAVLEMKMAA